MKKLADAQAAVDALNEALKSDPQALSRLFRLRVPFKGQVDDRPGMVVRDEGGGTCSLAVGGLIQALIEGNDKVRVAQQWDGDRLVGFEVWRPKEDE